MSSLSYQLIKKNYLEMDDAKLMSKHAKTFFLASLIFSKNVFEKVAKFYKLCRFIDDCADCLEPKEAKNALIEIKLSLDQSSLLPIIDEIYSLGIQKRQIETLIQGAEFDLSSGQVNTRDDLMLYCHRVAGIVGLSMCPLIGVSDPKAYPHADDLGSAMQLTNICRDIKEDVLNNRCYIAQRDLNRIDLNQSDLLNLQETPETLKRIISLYLATADKLYQSAYHGLAYIPFRARLTILFASEMYRHIGVKIRRNNFEVLRGRTYLTRLEKLLVALKLIPLLFCSFFWKTRAHDKKIKESFLGEDLI